MKRDLVVSIIGRPNVGKSSLFNRLMKRQHKALTLDRPGVTRDRHYGIAHLEELPTQPEQDIVLVDTGGFYPDRVEEGKDNVSAFFNIMKDHARLAINESDLVLFVVDVREGILPVDREIATAIRTLKRPFWLVVNKYDDESQAGTELEFYELGIDPEEMFTLSASHGSGVATLREALQLRSIAFQSNEAETAPTLQQGVTPRENVVARVAIIGAPNAGKSTMLNQLLGSERALVSSIAGTTVDPIEGYFDLYFGPEALELDKRVELIQHDGPLVQQYEHFRQNNPEFFDRMSDAYEEEGDFDETAEQYADDINPDEVNFEDEADEAELDKQLYAKAFGSLDDSPEEISLDSSEEAINAPEGSFWRTVHIVDTAGIRRQKSIDDPLEEQSVYRSLRSITESDLVVYMVDATKGVGHQDRRLLDIALDKGKSVIVVLNKMDIKNRDFKDDASRREWIADLRATLPWLSFCDVLPLSALKGTGLNVLKKALKKTVLIRRRPVPTGELNRQVFELIEKHPIVVKRTSGKRFKVRYASMVKMDPPTILLFSNKSKGIPDSYKRYLKNGLRRAFTLDNTPVHLLFRTGHDLAERMKKVKRG
tara:strand:- start:30184 stop:31971 length:1788 start_codon:yes stop_codon:yes gene_type:complete